MFLVQILRVLKNKIQMKKTEKKYQCTKEMSVDERNDMSVNREYGDKSVDIWDVCG